MARLTDSRRLTGRTVLLSGAGAVAEVALEDGDEVDALEVQLRAAIASTLAGVGLSDDGLVVRRTGQGLSLAVPAPLDALLTAADALEVAVAAVLRVEVDPAVADLAGTRAREQSAALLALRDEARRRGVPFLVDDEALTVGLGARGQSFPPGALPSPSAVVWDAVGAIPVALVTGTNGKTTTTRLLAAILARAGFVVGSTSTDGVAMDGIVVDSGDWSGPGGARRVLRDQRVEAAVLETARGGLLRRGLALEGYDVGVITNVADDHLGEFGVDTLEDMADVKWLVARGVREGGVVVVHADDPRLMARVPGCQARVVLVARDRARVAAWLSQGGEAWVVDDVAGTATIVRSRAGVTTPVIEVARVPLTFGGAATYNVDNALAAAAAACALGADDAAIAAGLQAVTPSVASSPGRSNVFNRPDGSVVVVDFAHNPAAVHALGTLVAHLRPAGARLIVGLGAPGDRLDSELTALAGSVADLGPDLVILRELPHYLRGRAQGAVPALLRAGLLARGVTVAADVADDDGPGITAALDALDALDALGPGDVAVFTPLVETDVVFGLVRARGFREAP